MASFSFRLGSGGPPKTVCFQNDHLVEMRRLRDAGPLQASYYARAATAYMKECEGGDALACSPLGDMYPYRLGVEQDKPLAATLFSKGPNAGSGNGCLNLGCCVNILW